MHAPGSAGLGETRAVSCRPSERRARRARAACAGRDREGGRGRAGPRLGRTVRDPDGLQSPEGWWPPGAGGGVCVPRAALHTALSRAPAAAPPRRPWARGYFQAMTSPGPVKWRRLGGARLQGARHAGGGKGEGAGQTLAGTRHAGGGGGARPARGGAPAAGPGLWERGAREMESARGRGASWREGGTRCGAGGALLPRLGNALP